MRKFRYSQGFRVDENNSLQMKGCQLHMVINVHNINQGKILDLLDNLDYEFTSMIKEEIENTDHESSAWDMGGDGYEV